MGKALIFLMIAVLVSLVGVATYPSFSETFFDSSNNVSKQWQKASQICKDATIDDYVYTCEKEEPFIFKEFKQFSVRCYYKWIGDARTNCGIDWILKREYNYDDYVNICKSQESFEEAISYCNTLVLPELEGIKKNEM